MDENKLNELIEINLEKIYKAPSQYMMRQNFSSLEKRQLPVSDQNILARYMCEFGLTEMQSDHRSNLTTFGRDVYNKGGWKEYLTLIEREKIAQTQRQSITDKTLEIDLHSKKQSAKHDSFIKWAGLIVATAAVVITTMQACREDKIEHTTPLPQEKTKSDYAKH